MHLPHQGRTGSSPSPTRAGPVQVPLPPGQDWGMPFPHQSSTGVCPSSTRAGLGYAPPPLGQDWGMPLSLPLGQDRTGVCPSLFLLARTGLGYAPLSSSWPGQDWGMPLSLPLGQDRTGVCAHPPPTWPIRDWGIPLSPLDRTSHEQDVTQAVRLLRFHVGEHDGRKLWCSSRKKRP